MYKYGVFISYKRDSGHEEWINAVFYPIVRSFFMDRYQQNLAFKDTDQQEANYGKSVDQFLKSGLVQSVCMIAILSGPYFCNSQWCPTEFSIMQHRAEKHQIPLLFPVVFINENKKSILRDRCPQLAIKIEESYMPLLISEKQFYHTNKAFIDSNDYIELKNKIRSWLENSIVPAIKSRPNWSDEWATEEWIQTPYLNFKPKIDCQELLDFESI